MKKTKIELKVEKFEKLQKEIMPTVKAVRKEKRANKTPYMLNDINKFIDESYQIVAEIESLSDENNEDIIKAKNYIFARIDALEEANQYQIELEDAYRAMNKELDKMIALSETNLK